MKQFITALLIVLIFSCSKGSNLSDGNSNGNNSSSSLIGTKGQAGGIIFYDKGNKIGGWQFLEVSPEDMKDDSQWACSGLLIAGAKNDSLGGGYQNTIDMINAGCVYPSWAIPSAAQSARAYKLNNYSDWYLPSRAELELIYSNLVLTNKVVFKINPYWSSTQKDLYNAYYLMLDHVGGGGYNGKLSGGHIRPVRRY